MSQSRKSVPKRRFMEFNNAVAWEQRKLEDILDVRSGRDYKHLDSGDIPVYGTGGYMLSVGEALSYEEDAIGIGRKGTIDKPYILKAPFWTVDTLFYTVPKRDSDLNFIHSIFQKINWKSKDESTGVPSLSKTTINAVSVFTPSCSEQKEIGTFFNKLDDTIALHQRKLEKIKALKTAYLSEMFPAEGETKPKRRFAGFTDDWEQRKFEDCFKFPVSTNSLSRVMLNYDKGEVKNVHYGDVLIKYPCILNIKKEEIPYITGGCLKTYNSNLLENGDLIFADAAEDETVGKAVEVNGITNENLVSGLHTIVARATTQKAKYFLGYYINSDIYHRQLLRLMQGSKVSAISKGNLQKTDVSFPKDIEEQQKIGSYFKQLDDTITLHQRKLKKLQSIKKAYLNEMFI
ncbi:restriction endonuclease subunit S [Listeria innocua]|uniref:restriction endonuclease subunit S n=1 Tax=Listeria innocua TaxID=1642 RepID=UPI0018092EF6|nr:restriction endonuclease subunit S [Listeria innocua]MBC1415940.1 restriction endonuclease subunit S [Listeria innocua]